MKKILITMILILTILITIILINFNNINLKIKGYSFDEIKLINDKLNESNIKSLLEKNYIKNLDKLLTSNNFNINNLDKYLKYINTSFNAEEIVYIVNNDYDNYDLLVSLKSNVSFNFNNLDRYIAYHKNNKDIDSNIIIDIVNNDIDLLTMKYDSNITNFTNETYFIKDNLERYLNYYNNNTELTFKEVVTRINSNLDYDYYTNIVSTDIDKGNLLLVNKYYKLDSNYVPNNLVTMSSKYGSGQLSSDAYEEFKKLVDAAKKEGYYIYGISPYRSYSKQEYLYNKYVLNDGVKKADTYSARAGHSEHQTGLAVDVSSSDYNMDNFGNTKEYKWMINNAHKYGFILRYPNNKQYITGYKYEPWHYRYVGVDVASKIKELDITFEEYYAYYIK